MRQRKAVGLRLTALLAALALVVAACGGDDDPDTTDAPGDETTTTAGGDAGGDYTIGVSNTLVGNAWREQMMCSIKAEALASGQVSQVIEANRNAEATEQIADIQGFISQGVDAIILNPADREALNPAIEEAIEAGIVVVSVDSPVTAEGAYIVANNQELYGELGARALFEALDGEGNVVYMRGADGVPADTDRNIGFQAALADFPGITIIAETFTGWDPTVGAQQALEALNAYDVDGFWTSGIDYTVVEQFAVAGADPVPVIGADNNAFIGQLIDGQPGAAVTNPPAIGGVGVAIALDILNGESVSNETLIDPAVFDHGVDAAAIEAVYIDDLPAGWSSYMEIDPYTSHTAEQVIACDGP